MLSVSFSRVSGSPGFLSICVVLVVASLLAMGWGVDAAAIHKTAGSTISSPRVTDSTLMTPAGNTINVNSPFDVVNSADNSCTLREAIIAANTNVASGAGFGECAAGSASGSDVIDVTFVIGTISLSSALPNLTSDVNINGSGPGNLTIQRSTAAGTADFRIFTVNSGVTANISGLTISNGRLTFGNTGGGVLNKGTLTLLNVTVSGNNVFTAASGGGIMNDGSLTLINSTVSDNFSDSGGGLANRGALVVTNSTVSNNRCVFGGGGLYNNSSSAVSLTNSTISGNSAGFDNGDGGGLYNQSGTVTLTNITLSANSASQRAGGIFILGGTVNLGNSIVANNTAGGIPYDINGAVNSQDYNLIGSTSGASFTGTTTHNLTNVDPRLGPLASNNGTTQTQALLPGSPAIDAGNSLLTTDQRGQARPIDEPNEANASGSNASDIGAYEAHTFEVNSNSDTSDGQCAPLSLGNGCTLREAIAAANAENGAELITFAPALTAGGPNTITLSTALPDLSSNMTIYGPGQNSLTIQRSTVAGTPLLRIFTVPSGTSVNISGLTISKGKVGNRGGGILNQGTLDLSDSVVSGNSGFGGGGIHNENLGTLTIRHCIISDNFSTNLSGSGGGISGFPGTISITDSVIKNNDTGSGGGGGVYNGGGLLTVTRSTFSGNTHEAIFNESQSGSAAAAHATVINSTISGNPDGGCLNVGGIFTLLSSTVTNNTGNGGGIGNVDDGFGSDFKIGNTIVAGNSSPRIPQDADGTFQSQGNNLIGKSVGSSGFLNGVNGDQVGTSASPINPRLGPLADYGGPTQTHALLPGSPAMDAGSNALADSTGLTTDQRGTVYNRFIDGADPDLIATVDIGAFEAQASIEDIPDQTINEDSQLQFSFNIGGGVTGMTAVSSNEALVPNIYLVNIEISGGGSTRTLMVKPQSNQFGATTITVVVDSPYSQVMIDTFVLTVNPVNDVPSFTKGADQMVKNDAGAQTVTNWATGISAGPANESGQTLTFQVTGNTNPSIFASAPAINSAGTLSYTPATNASGSAAITINLKDNGGTANGGVDTSPSQTFNITVTSAGSVINFNSATYNTTESSGFVSVTVKRTGDLSAPATVNYATSGNNGLPCSTANGTATPKCDFTNALGTLMFAAGEDTKTVDILITQDSFVEGPETFTITLSNPTNNSSIGTIPTATTTIADDAAEPVTNPIDDARNFVRQHYHDFLNREPDQNGWDFWTNEITSCGADAACREVKRNNVSASFFLSIEFQQSGYLVERFYKTAFGDAPGTSTFGSNHQLNVPIVRFDEFLTDTQRIGRGVIVLAPGWEQALESNKQVYAREFVQTARFTTALPTTMTPDQFVDRLNQNAGGVLSASERQAVSNLFAGAANTLDLTARSKALRMVADDPDLNSAEFNRAFVLAQFFGYLRRNPNDAPDNDYTGYDFWLTKLNQFNGDYIKAEMVKAFISSGEYRQRFGS